MTSKKKPSKAAAHQRFTEDEVVSSFAKACQQNSLETTLRQSFHFSDVGILRGLQCFLSRLALGSGGELCLGSGCALRFRTFAVHPPAHLTICPGQFGNRGQFVDSRSKEVSSSRGGVLGGRQRRKAYDESGSHCRQLDMQTRLGPDRHVSPGLEASGAVWGGGSSKCTDTHRDCGGPLPIARFI